MNEFIWVNVTTESGELLDRFKVMDSHDFDDENASEIPADVEFVDGTGHFEIGTRLTQQLRVAKQKAVKP